MKKVFRFIVFILIILVTVSCQQQTESKQEEPKSSTQENSKDNKESEEKKIYQLNEEAFITDENGEPVYSLTINNVKIAQIEDEDLEYVPQGSKLNVVVTYTYKYIKSNEDIGMLTVNPYDLTVFDRNNTAAELMDFGTGYYPFDADTPEIAVGRNVQTYYVYALKNESDKVQIDFTSALFEQTITFEASIEK